jgi:WD40 repeat protein
MEIDNLPGGLLGLPNEIWNAIIFCLSPRDLIYLSYCSKRFYALVNQRIVWEPHFARDFPLQKLISTRQYKHRIEEPRFYRIEYGFQAAISNHFRMRKIKSHTATVSQSFSTPSLFRFFSDYGHSAVTVIGFETVVAIWNVEAEPYPIMTMQIPVNDFVAQDYSLQHKCVMGVTSDDSLEVWKLDKFMDDFVMSPLEMPDLGGNNWMTPKFASNMAMSCLHRNARDSMFYIWDLHTTKICETIDMKSPSCGTHKWLDADRTLLTGHAESMKLWDCKQKPSLIKSWHRPFEVELFTVAMGSGLLGCSGDKGYMFWDKRKLDEPLEVHNDYITNRCLVFDIGDSFVTASDEFGGLEILLKKSVTITAEPLRLSLPTPLCAVGSNEKIIVLYDNSAKLHVWDLLQNL